MPDSLWPMNCSTPDFPVVHYLPEFAETHVHWVSDTIQPSHPLLPPFLFLSIFPSIRVFSSESALCIRWPKCWSFSFSISPSNEYSGLILLRWTGWISLLSKGLPRVFSNNRVKKHHSLVLDLLYGLTVISVHDYWKNYGLDCMNLCQQSNISVF